MQALFCGLPELLRLESQIDKKSNNVFRIRTYLRLKHDTSDQTGHRILQREVKKNPAFLRKSREFSRKCVPYRDEPLLGLG
jgi:hypothetical protein